MAYHGNYMIAIKNEILVFYLFGSLLGDPSNLERVPAQKLPALAQRTRRVTAPKKGADRAIA